MKGVNCNHDDVMSLFQVSMFVCVMSLDARRQRSFRTDLFFIPLTKTTQPDPCSKHSFLYMFMKKIWSFVVLQPLLRPVWVSVAQY